MNALEWLREDHETINRLFDEMSQVEELSERRELFEELRQDLDTHLQLEESVFYPVFSERDEFDEIIEDSVDRIQEMRDLLDRISASVEEEEFDHQVEELIACFEDHIDEEEKELFKQADDVLTPEDLTQLGAQLEDAKQSFTEKAA